MAYLCSLIHRAAVYRPTKELDEIRQERVVFADDPVSGMSAVRCRLYPGRPRTTQRDWGRDVDVDGVVHFEATADIRPGLTASEGLGDRLVLTDASGRSLGTWHVVGVRDPALSNRMIVAAVKRWGA